MKNSYTKSNRLYRSRHGKIFGVCRGVADYFDISVFWLRVALIVAFAISGFWPVVVIYIGAAFILKEEPVLPLSDEDESEFYSSYASSRTMGLQRLKREFDQLNKRISRMEDAVTTKDYSWDKRYQSG